MTNEQIMNDYISGTRTVYGANHLLIDGNVLFNYSTAICEIDREAKKARLNVRKYSTTTSKIQSRLHSLLHQAGFEIEESEDFRFGGWWNFGYQGAQVYKADGSTRW